MTRRHAYLIMAHHELEILEKLIRLLDDERNDIYLHVDLKMKTFDVGGFQSIPVKSGMFVVPRATVNWGGFSQIQCELNLLRHALGGNYAYYHLISGVDLPLKPQDEIHEFFGRHEGSEFIHFVADDIEDFIPRVAVYHLDDYRGVIDNLTVKRAITVADKWYSALQKQFKIDRLKGADFSLKCGGQWFSITHDCAAFVVDNEEWIARHFSHSSCADELFLQTLVYNSVFKDNIFAGYPVGSYLNCMRYVDWKRGNPYIWRTDDFEELIDSGYLFARKFDTRVDGEIVDKICTHVNGKPAD